MDVRDTGVVKSDIDQEIENETKVSEDVGNNSLANDQVVPVEVTNPIDNQDNTVSDLQIMIIYLMIILQVIKMICQYLFLIQRIVM